MNERTAVEAAAPQLHPRTPDLTGQRYGRLTVESFTGYQLGSDGKRIAMWLCKCRCGATAPVRANNLRKGNTTSCGCYHRDAAAQRQVTHGLSGHPLHHVWRQMVQRCTNPNAASYPDYGGRGIKVCDRWRASFAAFLADVGERPPGTSLDRIDNDGNYEPSNVRWASDDLQRRNQRRNRWVEYGGARMVLTDWANALGIHHKTLHNRLGHLGWSIERALTTGVDPDRLAAVLSGNRIDLGAAA